MIGTKRLFEAWEIGSFSALTLCSTELRKAHSNSPRCLALGESSYRRFHIASTSESLVKRLSSSRCFMDGGVRSDFVAGVES